MNFCLDLLLLLLIDDCNVFALQINRLYVDLLIWKIIFFKTMFTATALVCQHYHGA